MRRWDYEQKENKGISRRYKEKGRLRREYRKENKEKDWDVNVERKKKDKEI